MTQAVLQQFSQHWFTTVYALSPLSRMNASTVELSWVSNNSTSNRELSICKRQIHSMYNVPDESLGDSSSWPCTKWTYPLRLQKWYISLYVSGLIVCIAGQTIEIPYSYIYFIYRILTGIIQHRWYQKSCITPTCLITEGCIGLLN